MARDWDVGAARTTIGAVAEPTPTLSCRNCSRTYDQGEAFCPVDGEPLSAVWSDAAVTDDRLGALVDGKYRILRRLASGGMGVVYAAMQHALGREVAVKFIRTDRDDVKAVQRFFREAQLASTLKSPHVVAIHDAGQTERGEPFIVMELLQGQSLSERLTQLGRLSLPEAVSVWSSAARGIAEAHRRGLIHRDVKPGNIVLVQYESPWPTAKVLDFGVAAAAPESDGQRRLEPLTESGVQPGTPAYLAPERRRGAQADARSDVFALGMVMYEMLTAKRPFKGDSIDEEPTPLEQAVVGLEVPAPLYALIWRCLAADPKLRPANAGVLAEAIDEAVEATGASRHASTTGDATTTGDDWSPNAADEPEGERRSAGRGWLSAAMGVLIGLGVGWWAFAPKNMNPSAAALEADGASEVRTVNTEKRTPEPRSKASEAGRNAAPKPLTTPPTTASTASQPPLVLEKGSAPELPVVTPSPAAKATKVSSTKKPTATRRATAVSKPAKSKPSLAPSTEPSKPPARDKVIDSLLGPSSPTP